MTRSIFLLLARRMLGVEVAAVVDVEARVDAGAVVP